MKPSGTFAFLCLLILVHFTFIAVSQDKIPLDHSVYNSWKNLKNSVISNNGSLIAFELDPQKGDGKLILFSVDAHEYDTIQRGANAALMPGADVMVFRIKPQFDTVRQAKLKKVKKDKLPKDSLGILIIADKKIMKFPAIKRVAVPEKESGWIAFLLEKPKAHNTENDTTAIKEKKKKKTKEGLLVILNPVTGDSVSFDHISRFAFSKNGRACAMIKT